MNNIRYAPLTFMLAVGTVMLLSGCLFASPQVVGAPVDVPSGGGDATAINVTYTPLPATPTPTPVDAARGAGTPSGLTPIVTQATDILMTSTPPATGTPAANAPTASASVTPARPVIYGFGIRPADRRVFLAWDALGERAFICPITEAGEFAAACFDVPLTGEQAVTLHTDEDGNGYTGFALHVIDGEVEIVEAVDIPDVPIGSREGP